MNWLDWVILGYVGLGILGGWRNGLASLLVGLAGYLLGWLGATVYAGPLEEYVQQRYHVVDDLAAYAGRYLPLGTTALHGLAASLAEVLSFLAIFAAVGAVVGILGGILAAPLIRLGPGINRIGGAVFGGGRHLLVAGIVLFLLAQVEGILPSPFSQDIAGAYDHSVLATPMVHAVQSIDPWTASPSSLTLSGYR